MELHLPKRIKTFYYSVFPVLFMLITYKQIVHDWQLTRFGFDELEDVGKIIFVLGVSACEAALMTVFLWWIIELMKVGLHSPN